MSFLRDVDKRFQYLLLLRGATVKHCANFAAISGFNTCSSCEEQLKTRRARRAYIVVSIPAPLARSNEYSWLNSHTA